MPGYRPLLIVSLLLFAGCAQKNTLLRQPLKTVDAVVDTKQSREDAYALIAMDAFERKDYQTASLFFEKLYDLDPQKSYLTDAIKAASLAKDYKRIKHLVEKARGKFENDRFLNRYLVAWYLDKHDLQKAQETVDKLLSNRPEAKDYELAALLAKARGDNEAAKAAYREAYKRSHDPKIAIALAHIALESHDTDEAIRLLETHRRFYGCDRGVCGMLVKIYTDREDLDGLETVYKSLYETTKDPHFANALLELWAYRKDYDDAIAFLKKYKLSEETLLDVYTAKQDYRRAYNLAMKLYHERGEPRFLARAAILEYEGAKHKTKKLLQSVIKKFEASVYTADDPLFYNYYAYLLIDHDIDVKKGIKLVQKALKAEPDSLYYIDTLAWGYYKLGKCKEAYTLLKPYESDRSQPEVIEHLEKIKACLKRIKHRDTR